MFLLDVCRALKKNNVNYAIAGGYAVALHGAVRGTVDVDIAVVMDLDNLKKIEKALNAISLKSRLPIDAEDLYKFKSEYMTKRNLIAWSFVNFKNPAQIVDVIITHDLKKMKSTKMKIHGQEISVLSKNDLIKMKKQAARPQDIEDVRALEEL